ncbi:MAG TPA: flagellin [Phycisphaerae bacterium]|nr:flagellin [Phycisphaerae bacterium]HNU44197.1 flagellin [Phycisphaerae bacterium]
MALTITNTNATNLLNILNRNSAAQAAVTTQLSTGRRINSGKDDPAGLIAWEGLKSELSAVNAALSNNQRSDAMLGVADASLGEIGNLLNQIQSLVSASTSDAGLTDAEIATNQAQVDDLLAAIDRIVQTTNFNGKRLLDGSFGIQTAGVLTNTDIEDLRVYSRSNSTSDTTITVTRVASASLASASLAAMGNGSTVRTHGDTELLIEGSLGATTINIGSGSSSAEIVAAVNRVKDQTGVSAIEASTFLSLNSTQFGEAEFVSVKVLSGGVVNGSYGSTTTADGTGNDLQHTAKTFGSDADIQVNGQTAGVDGLDVHYNGGGISLSFTLSSDFGSGTTVSPTTTFTVKAAGGATFQLGTTGSTRATIGLDSLATYELAGGNGTTRLSELKSGGSISLKDDVAGALNSVKAAIAEVANVRGRLGGFQKYQVGSAINSLQASQSGLSNAVSIIADTDYATAVTELNRQSVLVQSSISLMGVVNQQASQILALLG